MQGKCLFSDISSPEGNPGCPGKNTTNCYLFSFYFIIHFLLLDNSIAYMFIHTAHAYAHTLLHKMDGSKKNILKGTVKGTTTPCRR